MKLCNIEELSNLGSIKRPQVHRPNSFAPPFVHSNLHRVRMLDALDYNGWARASMLDARWMCTREQGQHAGCALDAH